MKVYVDDQIFTMQTHGGISRYFAELIMHISTQPDTDMKLTHSLSRTRNAHAIEGGLGKPLPAMLGTSGRLLRAVGPWRARQLSFDVVHHTYYHPQYLRLKPDALRVVTVYDMIPEVFPELFPLGSPHASKREFIDAADLIFCISNSAKNDLLSHFGTPRGRLVVTPLGVDDRFRAGATPLPGLPPSYVMFVGNRKGYKDFGVLISAFAELLRQFKDTWVVAVGGGGFSVTEHRNLSAAGLSGRVMQVTLNDADLHRAYANARAFVFPSRYEGFGLPTLEAMASGCPVVLADSSSHPEVGGSAALYFPPGDSSTLMSKLGDLLSNPILSTNMSEAGVARARRFSWSEVCSRTVAEYRRSWASAMETSTKGTTEGRS